MDNQSHTLNDLFRQLGMPASSKDITAFVANHNLPKGTSIAKAPFWEPAQANFLAEAIRDDADWALVVDELAARLSHDLKP